MVYHGGVRPGGITEGAGGELQTVDLQSSELEGRDRSSVLHYQRGYNEADSSPIIIVHSLVSYFSTLPSGAVRREDWLLDRQI